jgi:hypothetical protein
MHDIPCEVLEDRAHSGHGVIRTADESQQSVLCRLIASRYAAVKQGHSMMLTSPSQIADDPDCDGGRNHDHQIGMGRAEHAVFSSDNLGDLLGIDDGNYDDITYPGHFRRRPHKGGPTGQPVDSLGPKVENDWNAAPSRQADCDTRTDAAESDNSSSQGPADCVG